jgi:thymidylate kinase
MKENLSNLIALIEKIKDLVKQQGTNLLWTHYDSKEEVIDELERHIMLLQKEDFSKINELILLFAPTSDLQELSISNGWGKQFVEIAEKFDGIINEITD